MLFGDVLKGDSGARFTYVCSHLPVSGLGLSPGRTRDHSGAGRLSSEPRVP